MSEIHKSHPEVGIIPVSRHQPLPVSDQESGLQAQVAKISQAVRKRWLWVSAISVIGIVSVTVYTMTQPRIYQSRMVLLVTDNSSSAAVGLEAGVPTIQGNNLSTEVQILRSSSLIEQALASINDSSLRSSPDEVSSNLSIQQPENTDVLQISLTGTEPEKIEATLNALGTTYVNYSLNSRVSKASKATEFIEDQLPKAQEELNGSANALREFRQSYSLLDLEQFGNTLLQTRQGLEDQIYQAAIALEQTKQQYQVLQSQMAQAGLDPKSSLANAALTEDSGYRDLVNQLRQIDIQYIQERLRYSENNPIVEDLIIQRANVLALLQQRSEKILRRSVSASELAVGTIPSSENSVAQSLNSQLIATQVQLVGQNTQMEGLRYTQNLVAEQFREIPALQQEYAELQRQHQLNSSKYDLFLAKLQELELSQAEEIAPWQILEPPFLPRVPISPKVQQNILLGFLGSLGLGIWVAMLLESLDSRLKDPEEVKALLQLPVLGMIPRIDQPTGTRISVDSTHKLNDYNFSCFTESVRSLAFNLSYLSPKHGAKLLAFTSAIPEEGKSTLTYNLSVTIASLGYRVLLVEADMRKPQMKHYSHKASFPAIVPPFPEHGLSTVLSTNRSWRDCVYKSKTSHFHLLMAGGVPPNPMNLLNSGKMADLMKEWSAIYDYVLIDTPPIAGLTDTQSLATKVDEIILVVSLNSAPRSTVKRAKELLEELGCNIEGVVINRVSSQQQGYYYKYYNSYYQTNNSTENGVLKM